MNLLGRKALREEKGRKKENPAILTGIESSRGDYGQDDLFS